MIFKNMKLLFITVACVFAFSQVTPISNEVTWAKPTIKTTADGKWVTTIGYAGDHFFIVSNQFAVDSKSNENEMCKKSIITIWSTSTGAKLLEHELNGYINLQTMLK